MILARLTQDLPTKVWARWFNPLVKPLFLDVGYGQERNVT
jgi:hypothetical protein